MIISQKLLAAKIASHLLDKDAKSNVERAKKTELEGPRFYPSSANKCSRYIVYDMLGYPKPPKEPKLIRIMENGNSMHERYQTWFEEMGILVANEFPIKVPELRISGRLDSIITTKDIIPGVDDVAIVELKSANDKKFAQMVKSNEPNPDYYAQIQLYMELLKIPYGLIFIENKNNQEILEFLVDYDPEFGKRLLEKVVMVNDCVTKKELPRREYIKSSYECKWCDYHDTCWSAS